MESPVRTYSLLEFSRGGSSSVSKHRIALTSVAQWVGHHLAKQKATGSVPNQGTCLGCGFGPWSGHLQEVTD